MTHIRMYLGAGLLASTLLSSTALAQSLDLSAPPPAAGPVGASSGPTRYFLAEEMPTDGTPPRPLRDIREVTENSALIEERWYRANYPEHAANFDSNYRTTVSLCRTTGAHLAEADELLRLFAMLSPLFVEQYRELEALRPQIGRNDWLRRAFGLIATIIATTTTGGAYGGIVGAGVLGNEGSATTHNNAMDINTRLAMTNILVTLVNIRSQMLQLNVMKDYLVLMDTACGAANMYESSYDVRSTSVSYNYSPGR